MTVLRWRPLKALGLATPVPIEVGGGGKLSPKERARLAEQVRATLRVRMAEQVRVSEAIANGSEIRAINGKPWLVSGEQVRDWLSEHNRRFKLLSERALAGGKLRFRISDSEWKKAA